MDNSITKLLNDDNHGNDKIGEIRLEDTVNIEAITE